MKNKTIETTTTCAVVALVFCAASVLGAEAGAEAGAQKETVLSLIKKGGPVMYPLGIASILAVAMGVHCFITQSRENVMPESFLAGLKKAWSGDPSGKNALSFCDENGGTVGHIFKAGIRRVKLGREAVEKAIDDVGSREADKMKRSLRPIKNIAMVAPLLGLLGTVYGMIEAFQVTSESGGTASTALLAKGIYEALVTTAAGLTIAIPVLLLYNFLSGRVDRLIDEIDEAGSEFVFACANGGEVLLDEPEVSVESSVIKEESSSDENGDSEENSGEDGEGESTEEDSK